LSSFEKVLCQQDPWNSGMGRMREVRNLMPTMVNTICDLSKIDTAELDPEERFKIAQLAPVILDLSWCFHKGHLGAGRDSLTDAVTVVIARSERDNPPRLRLARAVNAQAQPIRGRALLVHPPAAKVPVEAVRPIVEMVSQAAKDLSE